MRTEFVYTQPVKIVFGSGCFEKLDAVLDGLGVKKAVLVCGRHFAPRAQAMQAGGGRYAAVFHDVEQAAAASSIRPNSPQPSPRIRATPSTTTGARSPSARIPA